MPLSSIAQILLRLAALNWLVAAVGQLVGTLLAYHVSELSVGTVISPLLLFLIGAGCWIVAPRLSRLLARGHDDTVTLEGVSLRNLYSVAFVSLGLYFALGNFARIFSWLHYYIAYKPAGLSVSADSNFTYNNLTEPAITFLAGVFLVATAPYWAGKLSAQTFRETG